MVQCHRNTGYNAYHCVCVCVCLCLVGENRCSREKESEKKREKPQCKWVHIHTKYFGKFCQAKATVVMDITALLPELLLLLILYYVHLPRHILTIGVVFVVVAVVVAVISSCLRMLEINTQ